MPEILDRVRESERNRGPRHSRVSPRERGRAAATGRREAAKRGAAAAKAGKRKQRPGRKERAIKKGRTLTSIVVGTAGHIDHGKSALVRALTGTDPDRLKEEQARGITIDLGFAHLEAGG